LLWDHPFYTPFEDTVITAVVRDGLVVVAGDNEPTAALRIEAVGGKLRPTVAWRNHALRSTLSSPIFWDGYLYGLTTSGRLVCVTLATGETAWTDGSFGRYGSLVAADGQLLVLTDVGELHALELNPKAYKPRARLALTEDGGTWAHLAVV